jgi:rubrerythrin
MLIRDEQLFLKNGNDKCRSMERLVKISFCANHFPISSETISENIFWNDDFFSLTDSHIWKNFNEQQKTTVLGKMNEHLLKEAYYIENAGMLYAAKMNILSDSQEERMFFSIMGHEEARHLQSLKPFLGSHITSGNVPTFSAQIGKIIQAGDKLSNLFLIQILLEGWGLSYYQTLALKSLNPELSETFQSIIKDETRHHAAGIMLMEKNPNPENSFFVDAFSNLLEMVRMGPWTLVNEINHATGGLSLNQLNILLHELDAVQETNQKLGRLKALTEKYLSSDLAHSFVRNKHWESYSIEDMARAHL